MDDYKVRIGGVVDGSYPYVFEIKDYFFAAFRSSEVIHAEILAVALLKKKENKLTLMLKLKGQIHHFLCDICAEDISLDISTKVELIIKETDEELESTSDIIYVKTNENEF